MSYYRSSAQIISQGFQKVLIYYFTIFLQITMNFQSGAFKSVKTREKGIEILHRGPCGKHKLNTNKLILFGTVHWSH